MKVQSHLTKKKTWVSIIPHETNGKGYGFPL